MKIGFIGLGIMGNPMVSNLLKSDMSVTAYDVRPELVEEVVEKGAIAASSPADVASESDVVFLMLPNAEIVKDVLFGENGVEKTIRPNTTIVDMSSLAPSESIDFANTLKQQDIIYLDAPVSGGEPKAIDGSLAIMIGGNESALQKVLPILEEMGNEITHVGVSGSGSTTKLANQIIVNVTIAAISEATVLCSKAGVEVDKMYHAIRNGLAGSTLLDAKIPLVLERNFVAGGRIDINLKDLSNVIDTGKDLKVPLPLTSNVREMFLDLCEDGKAADDHIGLIQHYEKRADFEV